MFCISDSYPTSNLDVAPTVASLLQLKMPDAQGRVLLEALSDARERFRVRHKNSDRFDGLPVLFCTDGQA